MKTQSEIENAMLEFVRSNCEPKAQSTDRLSSLQFDSLDGIEMVMDLEDELDVIIPDEWLVDGLENKTISELAQLLAAKLNTESSHAGLDDKQH